MNKSVKQLSAIGASLLMGVVGTNGANAQQNEVHGDWTVRCVERDGLPPCDIAQFVTERDGGDVVMQFSIAYAGKDDAYGLQIRMPLGQLRLDHGAAIKVDENAPLSSFQFTRCDETGCFVERFLKEDELTPFKKGNAGLLAVIRNDGQPMTIPLSFNGFSKALRVMRERNKKWALSF